MRNFSDLTEKEVLALAIANEEEDNRIYTDIAEGLRRTILPAPTCSLRWRRKRASTGTGLSSCTEKNSASTSR